MKRSGVDKDSAESICGKLQALTKDDCIQEALHHHKAKASSDKRSSHKSAVHPVGPKKKTTKVIK